MGITNFSRDMFSNFYPLHEMDIYFVLCHDMEIRIAIKVTLCSFIPWKVIYVY